MTISVFFTLLLSTLAFGCIIGAYFTTADHRIRHDEPLITSTCHCPICGHTLSSLHQIPLVSWILLGGKCHYCNAPIPARYPLIEGGFLCFYGLTFLLLKYHLILLLSVWFAFIGLLLLIRCQGHIRSMMKGMAIFSSYHVCYGIVLLVIYAALGLL